MGKENKKEKKLIGKSKYVFVLLALLYLGVSIAFVRNILKLELLPIKYTVILLAGFAVITIIVMMGICVGKKRSLIRRIIFLIIAIAASGGYIFGMKYIDATVDFMETMSEEFVETEEYYVVTLNNDTYLDIKSLDSKVIYCFTSNEDYTDVKNDILKEITVTFENTDSLESVSDSLLLGKVNAILVSASQYSLICDYFANFDTDTKIIYTAKHIIKGNTASEIKEDDSQYTIKNGKFSVYISGIDTGGDITNVARSDANIIISVNTDTREILLTAIPRDYYIPLHSNGQMDKLTHTGIYGIGETVSTVEDLLEIDINYYVRVNFLTVTELVDTLGGIDVKSEYSFSSCGVQFYRGTNHLNGKRTLIFSRERKSLPGGDRQRVKNQQAVIVAIMNKVLNSTTLLTKYTELLEAMNGYFQTNIEQHEISKIVREQLNDMRTWNINTISLNGESTMDITYSYGNLYTHVMKPYEDTVINAKTRINQVLGNIE